MCGVVEGAIIKAEPGVGLPVQPLHPEPLHASSLSLNTVSTPVHINSCKTVSAGATTISTLCLPNGQPLTDTSLLLPPCPTSPGSSPPTISIQEGPVDVVPNIHMSSTDSPPSHSPLPYTVTLALPNNNSTNLSNPLSLSALLPLHPLPPTPLLPPPPPHTRSPLLSITEVTNTLLDHNQ